MPSESGKIAVIAGSKSDMPVLKRIVDTARSLGIEVEAHILSAHRTPDDAAAFAKSAAQNGFGVVIAAAGKAAHLAGVIAGHTVLPVIGVPIGGAMAGGLDSLLSTVQMPPGVPVATVAVDGAENAAILAAQILALGDGALRERLIEKKSRMAEDVLAADSALDI